jgi:hypothetical protein
MRGNAIVRLSCHAVSACRAKQSPAARVLAPLVGRQGNHELRVLVMAKAIATASVGGEPIRP